MSQPSPHQKHVVYDPNQVAISTSSDVGLRRLKVQNIGEVALASLTSGLPVAVQLRSRDSQKTCLAGLPSELDYHAFECDQVSLSGLDSLVATTLHTAKHQKISRRDSEVLLEAEVFTIIEVGRGISHGLLTLNSFEVTASIVFGESESSAVQISFQTKRDRKAEESSIVCEDITGTVIKVTAERVADSYSVDLELGSQRDTDSLVRHDMYQQLLAAVKPDLMANSLIRFGASKAQKPHSVRGLVNNILPGFTDTLVNSVSPIVGRQISKFFRQ